MKCTGNERAFLIEAVNHLLESDDLKFESLCVAYKIDTEALHVRLSQYAAPAITPEQAQEAIAQVKAAKKEAGK